MLPQKDPGTVVLDLPAEQLTLNTATGTTTGVRYYPLPGGMSTAMVEGGARASLVC